MTDFVLQHFNYWVVIFLMMIGMYTVISRGHLLKKGHWSKYISDLRFHPLHQYWLYRRRYGPDCCRAGGREHW